MSQPNTITVGASTYTRFKPETNKTTYNESAHQLDLRKKLEFYRNTPVAMGASRGTNRTTVKFTVDVEVPNADGTGDIVLPLIVETKVSVPIGTPDATVTALLADVAAFEVSSEATSLRTLQDI